MIAGLLVSLVLVWRLAPDLPLRDAFRVVAMGTLAMGCGGSMTYGQTVGLTHDPALVGNREAWTWGMVGLALKGGVWIGVAGMFLGSGLGGRRWTPGAMAVFLGVLVGVFFLGVELFNRPFDPAARILPAMYFSADWRWQPGAELKPRPEVWGGMLLVWGVGCLWLGWARRDRLALALGLWGFLGGALGFPIGQSLQSWHAWNMEIFQAGWGLKVDPLINWWNWMETVFGGVMGAVLGWGATVHRGWILKSADRVLETAVVDLRREWEIILLSAHMVLLWWVEFSSVAWVDALYDMGIAMMVAPMVAVAGGRWAPFLVPLPVVLMPIAGKTAGHLVAQQGVPEIRAWVLAFGIPMVVAGAVVAGLVTRARRGFPAGPLLGGTLVVVVWGYFLLNLAIFRWPWPWESWTQRTPNALVFLACALSLTWAVLAEVRSGVRTMRPPPTGVSSDS
jgi:hypothetical protein